MRHGHSQTEHVTMDGHHNRVGTVTSSVSVHAKRAVDQALNSSAMSSATPSQRQAAFVSSIAGSETSYSKSEAYSPKYNDPNKYLPGGKPNPGYNYNVAKEGPKAGDWGYFQMNQNDVNEAVRLGMSPNVAQHLSGGGPQGTSSIEDQAGAVLQYMKLKYPSQFEKFSQTGDFEAMRKAAESKWHGLGRDSGGPARQAYQKMLEAMQSSGTSDWQFPKN